MKKSQKTKPRRLFGWVLAIVLILAAIGAFLTSRLLYGSIILALGLIVLPFFDSLLKKYAKIELSGWTKAIIVLGGFILLSTLELEQPTTRTDMLGSSFQTAIVVKADNEKEGVAWEYRYLRANACKGNGPQEVLRQSLEMRDGHTYDIILVSCRDGMNERHYFRIDRFFGKI